MSSGLFIKVDRDFPEHPETIGLSDKAFRYVVTFWCYSHRHNTNGKIPDALFSQVPPKVRQELLAHYVELVDGHPWMHDYVNHQQTAEEVADLQAKRRTAGSAGGKARAKNIARAKAIVKQIESNLQPDIDIDIEREKERGATAPSPRSRAVALPAAFEVTEDLKAWAREKAPGIDLAHETEKFRNYHQAKGTTFKDWAAAWRNWMTKAVEYGKNNPAAAAGGKKEWW